jgi:hypothetical protein
MSHDLRDEVCPGIDVGAGPTDGSRRITDGPLIGYCLRVIRVDLDKVDSLLKRTPSACVEWSAMTTAITQVHALCWRQATEAGVRRSPRITQSARRGNRDRGPAPADYQRAAAPPAFT